MPTYLRFFGAALFAICLLAPGGDASAMTFDCDDAYTPDELTVCGRQNLRDLDEELDELFQDALGEAHRDLIYMLEEMQAAWVRARNRCGASRACIRRHYRARIRELEGFLERLAAPQQPQQPQQPAGCTFYEHNNYGGQSVTLNPNEQVSFWGTTWDNKISSLRIGGNCRLTGYTRALYNGRDETYAGDTPSLGDMNDRISSAQCVCQ